MIVNELNINEYTVHQIVTQDFKMRKVCAKVVPKNLNDQKAAQNEMSTEIPEWLKTESDFLTRVITGDKSWFFKYDPETRRQSEKWHMPQPPGQKRARMRK
jgi:hypothetical protein